MKMSGRKSYKVAEMASEYRFDYHKAKPNRFAETMNLNLGWTVERFVVEENEVKIRSLRGKKQNVTTSK